MNTETDSISIQSFGGKARAAALTPEQRSKIASDAAVKRWDGTSKQRQQFCCKLVDKFPDFDSQWDEETKRRWFDLFEKMIPVVAEAERASDGH